MPGLPQPPASARTSEPEQGIEALYFIGVFIAGAKILKQFHSFLVAIAIDQQANEAERSHILTSSMIRWDIVNFTVIRDFVEGTLQPGARRLTVDEGIITYSRSGDGLSPEAIANLDRAIEEIASGEMDIPTEPTGELLQPSG